MNLYLEYILGAFLLGILFLISDYLKKTNDLKEKMKEYYDLEDENNELKMIIFDLVEDKKFLMEGIMEFKDGGITKEELIKYNQSLINKAKEGIEKRRLEKMQNRTKISEIFGVNLEKEDKNI